MAACRRLAADKDKANIHGRPCRVNDTLHEACVALHRERIDIIIIYYH